LPHLLDDSVNTFAFGFFGTSGKFVEDFGADCQGSSFLGLYSSVYLYLLLRGRGYSALARDTGTSLRGALDTLQHVWTAVTGARAGRVHNDIGFNDRTLSLARLGYPVSGSWFVRGPHCVQNSQIVDDVVLVMDFLLGFRVSHFLPVQAVETAMLLRSRVCLLSAAFSTQK
jgi:hypothetical protein